MARGIKVANVTAQLSIEGLAEAKAEVRRAFRDLSAKVKVKLEGTTAASARLAALSRDRRVNIKVDMDRSSVSRAASALGSIKLPSLNIGGLPGIAVALKGLAVAAAAAATVVGGLGNALVQLSGIAVALPGALGGVAAIFGALKIGLSGVGDAFDALKAQSKAGGIAAQAVTNMQALADSTENARYQLRQLLIRGPEDLAAQERTLASAQRSLADAQGKLADARDKAARKLADYQRQLNGVALSERQAQHAVDDAQAHLTEIQQGPGASSRDVNDAKDALEQAKLDQQNLLADNQQLQKDAAAAAKKGVEGSEEVVAARQDEADAAQRVRDEETSLRRAREDNAHAVIMAQQALTAALAAQTEGSKSLATATAAVDEALDKLSPNARKFVLTWRDITKAFDTTRRQIQDRLFAGLGDELQGLYQKQFPNLRDGLGKIADSLNGIAREAMNFGQSDRGVSNMGRLFDGIADALARLRPAITPLLDAFTTIAAVGAESFGPLADRIAAASQKFAEFIAHKEATGELRATIDKAYDAFGHLFSIIGNVGSILKSVFEGFDVTGGNLLGTIDALTGKWADFLKSAEGQNKIADLLDRIKSAGGGVVELFGKITDAMSGKKTDMEGPFGFLLNIFASLQPIMKALQPVFDKLIPIIGKLAEAFAPLVVTLVEAFVPILDALMPILDDLMPVFAALFDEIGKLITPFAEIIALVLQLAEPLIKFLAPILVKLMPIIVALLLPLGKIGGILKFVGKIVGESIGLFGRFGKLIGGAVSKAFELVGAVFSKFGEWLGNLPRIVGIALRGVLRWFEELPKKIGEFFSNAWDWLKDAGGKIIGGLWDGIKGVAENVWGWLSELPGKIGGFFADAGKWLFDKGRDIITGAWDGIKKVAENVWSWFGELPGKIAGFFAGAGGWLLSKGGDLLTGLLGGLTGGIGKVWSWFTSLPGKIGGFFAGAGKWLFDAGKNVIHGLWEGIKNVGAKIGEWFLDILPGWIKTPFKKALGIHSPSRVFAGYGTNIIDGLLQGIGSQENSAVGKMAALGDSMSKAFQPKFALPDMTDLFTQANDEARSVWDALSDWSNPKAFTAASADRHVLTARTRIDAAAANAARLTGSSPAGAAPTSTVTVEQHFHGVQSIDATVLPMIEKSASDAWLKVARQQGALTSGKVT